MANAWSELEVDRDLRAILLLCASLGPAQADGPRPLNAREYEQLVRWLNAHELCPGDLLDPDVLQGAFDDVPISPGRIEALLDRDAALRTCIEDWRERGLWIVTPGDRDYPPRLLDQPFFAAPPLLFGVGDPRLLAAGGLAIVGSRSTDNEALCFTREVARSCANQEIAVISGGARGVDEAAMQTALEAGGRVAGIVADRLARTALLAGYQDALREGRLVLASPYDPHSGFHVGNAMGRNKHIYAIADWGLVVSTSFETGGTWAGAVEALKQGREVFVRTQGPEGNRKLVELGAYPFPGPWPRLAETLNETGYAALLDTQPRAYDLVLPLLMSHLEQPRDLPTLAQLLGVHQAQAKAWVNRAIREGRIEPGVGPAAEHYVRSRQQRMPFVAEVAGTYDEAPDAGGRSFADDSSDYLFNDL